MLSFSRLLAGALAATSMACGGHSIDDDSCHLYLVCLYRIGMPAGPQLDAKYGPMGTCWDSTQEAADTCNAECAGGLKAINAANSDAGC